MPAGGKKSQRAAQVGSKRGAQLCRELPRFSARAPSTSSATCPDRGKPNQRAPLSICRPGHPYHLSACQLLLAAQGSLSHPHAFVVCAQYLYTRKLAKKAFSVKTITNANFSTLVAEYFVSLAFYKLYCSQLFPRYNNNMCDTKSHDS